MNLRPALARHEISAARCLRGGTQAAHARGALARRRAERLDPAIDQATIRLLTRNGTEAVVTQGEACRGSPAHHMGKEKAALARAMARATGKPYYSALHIPTCRKCCALPMGGMADRKDAAANRLAFDKARADKEGHAKNAHDQSREAKRHDVHEGHMKLFEVHEGTKTEAGVRERIV